MKLSFITTVKKNSNNKLNWTIMQSFALLILVIIGFTTSLSAQTALRMDGIDDYVRTSSPVSMSNTWTYETWVKPNDLSSPNWSGIITSHSEAGSGMWFQFSLDENGQLRWESSGPGLSIAGIGPKINDNTWHHVAATSDGSFIRFYTDGVLQNETAFSSGSMDRTIHIMSERVPNQFIPGEVDKTMIWNYARSVGEINSDMSVCLSGNETGLLIYYRYEDGAGSAIVTDYAALEGNNYGNLMNMDNSTAWVSNIFDICAKFISKNGELSQSPLNNVSKNGAIGGDGLTPNGQILIIVH
ncbi:MAG: LamG domain-containing protein [bacterium]